MASKSEKFVKDQQPDIPSDGGPLGVYNGAKPDAPAWFEEAVSARYDTNEIEVKGARVKYQSWGSPDNPGLLLAHGNGAHAHWWDFIAPYFAEKYNVVALSFSGMGDSDWRDAYDIPTFAEEEIAVCEACGMFDHEVKPIICAHSFGGFVTLYAGAKYGERLTGTVIIDSPVNPPDRNRQRKERELRPHKVYPSLVKALSRFRLAPTQLCENHYILDYIGRWSIKKADEEIDETGDSWTWKFDPSIWQRFDPPEEPSDMLKETKCRIAIFRGEESRLMPDTVGAYMQELLGHQVPFVSIPHARHHVMLDQPIAFVSALRTLLTEWDHSSPHREV